MRILVVSQFEIQPQFRLVDAGLKARSTGFRSEDFN